MTENDPKKQPTCIQKRTKKRKGTKERKRKKNVKKLKNKIFTYKYRHATSTLHTWLLPPS